MTTRILPAPAPFHFRDVVFSHGWLRLAPFQWDEEAATLSRVELVNTPQGEAKPVQFALQGDSSGVLLTTDTEDGAQLAELERRVRWMLALEDDLAGFHRLCADEPRLMEAAERGKGRVLRSPTVWEDLVKTLFSVNTTWGQTVSMTGRLVGLCGTESPHGKAFPTSAQVAARTPEELQRECRVGYRALALWTVARDLAEGTLNLEALKDPALTTEAVEARLRAIRGIGPYAAANVLLLLGRYDHLPVDSWFRKTVRDGWFEGEAVPDAQLVAAFERFRPYRTLVYYFYNWSSRKAEVLGDAPSGDQLSVAGA